MKKSFTEQIKKKKEIEKDEKVRSNIRFKRSRENTEGRRLSIQEKFPELKSLSFQTESTHQVTKTGKENRPIPRHKLQNFRTLAKKILSF